ncbi:MAG TPA: right-handed parallel beta-helix repeat-containing protein [Polyangiaceae bacterium]|jgi:hypothetical protein
MSRGLHTRFVILGGLAAGCLVGKVEINPSLQSAGASGTVDAGGATVGGLAGQAGFINSGGTGGASAGNAGTSGDAGAIGGDGTGSGGIAGGAGTAGVGGAMGGAAGAGTGGTQSGGSAGLAGGAAGSSGTAGAGGKAGAGGQAGVGGGNAGAGGSSQGGGSGYAGAGATDGASGKTYYVAPTGSDANAGTQASPWASMAHAHSVMAAGDVTYFRGGTYAYSTATASCSSQTATVNAITLSNSGTTGHLISYLAYPGEVPVLDFSSMTDSCRITGLRVTSSWIHLKGFEIKGVRQNNNLNHESWGVWNSGGNNTFELLNIHNIMGTGLYVASGGNNLILNCDSHDNYDAMSTAPGEYAHGFNLPIAAGATGNVVRGCRAWLNSSSGYVLFSAQEAITVENSWAWSNGYLSDQTKANGNGNGFEGGGYGVPPVGVPATPPQHTVQFCVAFLNRVNGFYADHHPVADRWYNNTSYANTGAAFDMLGIDMLGNPIDLGILRNNLAFLGVAISNHTGAGIDDQYNSWSPSLGVSPTAADFQSTTTTGWDAPRQADGSLPVLSALHLAATSDLINVGQSVGGPYLGSAPDLGAFELK